MPHNAFMLRNKSYRIGRGSESEKTPGMEQIFLEKMIDASCPLFLAVELFPVPTTGASSTTKAIYKNLC